LPRKHCSTRATEAFYFTFSWLRVLQGLTEENYEAFAYRNVHARLVVGLLTVHAKSATILDAMGLVLDGLLLHTRIGGNKSPNILISLTARTLGNAIIIAAVERIQKLRCEKTVLASNAIQGESRATSLLTHLCDAVVTLDDGLRLALPCPKLTGLLLRPPDNVLCGVCFTELLENEDRQCFEAFVSEKRTDESGRLTVRLRTSMMQSVRCELHHLSFAQLNAVGCEDIWHVLGISELGDHNSIQFEAKDLRVIPEVPRASADDVRKSSMDISHSEGRIAAGSDDDQACGTEDSSAPPESCSESCSEVSSGIGESPSASFGSKDCRRNAGDYPGHSCLTMSWHHCKVSFHDAAKRKVLDTDVAHHDAYVSAMTHWDSTSGFLHDLTSEMVRSLRKMYGMKMLRIARLGLSMSIKLSFSTQVHLPHELLVSSDSLPHRCFQQVTLKKSKTAGAKRLEDLAKSSADLDAGMDASTRTTLAL